MEFTKLQYETVDVNIISLSDEDVITTSKPFDGEDDNVNDW
jgi:hypothetical protein